MAHVWGPSVEGGARYDHPFGIDPGEASRATLEALPEAKHGTILDGQPLPAINHYSAIGTVLMPDLAPEILRQYSYWLAWRLDDGSPKFNFAHGPTSRVAKPEHAQ